MMDSTSSKALMLISVIALYKTIRFISASLHASRLVPTNSSNNEIVPISNSSEIAVTSAITKHHVFLSFRGEDTRDTFTSHLYEALCKANIKTYMDHKLHKGEQISQALMKVIEESAISVIIFSKDYASSTWCLDEVIKIMECKEKYGRSVIPVFYNVDPSNVRKQSGSYGDAFAKLKQRFKHNKQKLQMWRDALTQATSLSGWDSKNVRPESELIKKIVKDILSKLVGISSCDFEGLIGIRGHVEKIEEIMLEAQIVGIWGMGGIGKTTLAKVVFDELKEQFESFSFIENVREQLKRIGLDELQEKCLKELLKDEDIDIYNIRSTFVKNRLQHKKILLVLDDVDNSVQVEDLTKVCNWFGQGSRIIITSRDIQVLKNASAFKTYHVQNMDSHDALHLFSWKAFKENLPTNKSYMKLSEWIVRYCEGNRLALTVLGCFLYGRSKKEWESALEKLKESPHMDIIKVLRLSFDGLDDKQKNLFIDLTYFLRGKFSLSMDFIRDYHDSSIDIEISVLKDKSLISVDEYSGNIEISMHDLVMKMGQEISRQQLITDFRRPIRVSKHDDVYQFFTNNKGAETIQYISLDMCKTKGILLKANALEKMYHLKFFKFYKSNRKQPSNVYIFEGLNELPENLRIFYWQDYPLPYVPLSKCAENLVEIEMPYSRLQHLWDGNQHFPKLKKVNLFGSQHLISLPDLSHAPNIEYVDVGKCINLAQIHSSSFLPKLENLRLVSSKTPRCVNIGSKINGNLGFVAVHNIFDLVDLSLHKVSMKVFISDGGTEISGFKVKGVSIPFTRNISECISLLLPFVRKVYLLDEIESQNFKKHFQTFLRHYKLGLEFNDLHIFPKTEIMKSKRVDSSFGMEQSGNGEKSSRKEDECCSTIGNSREKILRDTSETHHVEWNSFTYVSLFSHNCTKIHHEIHSRDSCILMTRVPKNINRWSLLTQLKLQKRDILDEETTIPGFSALKSLAKAKYCSSIQPITNLTFSRNITGRNDNIKLRIQYDRHCIGDCFSCVDFHIWSFSNEFMFTFSDFKFKWPS